jgi:hypothetical protein
LQGAVGVAAHYWREENAVKHTKQHWGGTEHSMRLSAAGMSELDESEQHLPPPEHHVSIDVAMYHMPEVHSSCADSGLTKAVPHTDEGIDCCVDESSLMIAPDL